MERPWLTEPMQMDFIHAGLQCAMRRGPFGAWCGYVGVPEEHPFYGVQYGDKVDFSDSGRLPIDMQRLGPINVFISALDPDRDNNSIELCMILPCHGGITFSGEGDHLPQASEKLWWLGFDCGHAWDLAPAICDSQHPDFPPGMPLPPKSFLSDLTYRTADYVVNELRQLATKLHDFANAKILVTTEDEKG